MHLPVHTYTYAYMRMCSSSLSMYSLTSTASTWHLAASPRVSASDSQRPCQACMCPPNLHRLGMCLHTRLCLTVPYFTLPYLHRLGVRGGARCGGGQRERYADATCDHRRLWAVPHNTTVTMDLDDGSGRFRTRFGRVLPQSSARVLHAFLCLCVSRVR